MHIGTTGKIKRVVRTSVGEIIDTLFPIRKRRVILLMGKIKHSVEGFTGGKIYERPIYVKDTCFLIRGVPDQVDYKNNLIIELKTIRGRKVSEFMLKRARLQVQLYMFLTGITRAKIIFKERDTGKVIMEVYEEFNEKVIKEAMAYFYLLKMGQLLDLEKRSKEELKEIEESTLYI